MSFFLIQIILGFEEMLTLNVLTAFIFKKFEVDPALATGPFVATFNDVIGLMIYFSLLALSLKFILVA